MDIEQTIQRINTAKSIKLRAKQLAGGQYSLYLDIWINNKRQYQTLKIYIENKPETVKIDDDKFKLAVMIRDKKEMELAAAENDYTLKNSALELKVLMFLREAIKSKKACYYKSMTDQFEAFKKDMTFRDLTPSACESFYKFMTKNLRLNSVSMYFTVFRHILNEAIKTGIIKENPTSYIKTEKEETKREYLTAAEIKQLILTHCDNSQTRNMFLFSCFTGLRYSDIIKLKWSDIKGDYIEFKQQKTGGIERMKLSGSAKDILAQLKPGKSIVFEKTKCKQPRSTNLQLRDWAESAGIKKHLSFHCARHTFATMCLTADIDIFTVSKLLGHKDIKTTQIYAKLIDKKKDDAVDKLPDFSSTGSNIK